MRKLVASLLLMPALFLPLASFAYDEEDETSEHIIGPATVDEVIEPVLSDPIDVSEIVITTKTPADEFVSATTPLVVALGVGSLGLVIYTLARGSERADKD